MFLLLETSFFHEIIFCRDLSLCKIPHFFFFLKVCLEEVPRIIFKRKNTNINTQIHTHTHTHLKKKEKKKRKIKLFKFVVDPSCIHFAFDTGSLRVFIISSPAVLLPFSYLLSFPPTLSVDSNHASLSLTFFSLELAFPPIPFRKS